MTLAAVEPVRYEFFHPSLRLLEPQLCGVDGFAHQKSRHLERARHSTITTALPVFLQKSLFGILPGNARPAPGLLSSTFGRSSISHVRKHARDFFLPRPGRTSRRHDLVGPSRLTSGPIFFFGKPIGTWVKSR
jgi:hypothetical protein